MWLAQRITESKDQRHLRRETNKAIKTEHARLNEDLVKATECHQLTKGLADYHREEMLTLNQPLPDAAFTPKQIIQLEIYATRHHDPLERQKVKTTITRAELAAQIHSKQTQPTKCKYPLVSICVAQTSSKYTKEGITTSPGPDRMAFSLTKLARRQVHIYCPEPGSRSRTFSDQW